MSEARIKVRPHQWWVNEGYWWATCSWCGAVAVRRDTIAAAADAGRAHFLEFHATKDDRVSAALDLFEADHPEGYSRRCGIPVASCAATECECAQNHTGVVSGPENPVQRVTPLVDAAADRAFRPCDRPDCPICTAQQATPPQAIQPLDPMRHEKAHTAALAAIQRSIDTRE